MSATATLALLVPLALAGGDEPPVRPLLVAHAGGALDGTPAVSNSREAFERSAAAGFRLVELDFSWTRDGRLVLLHDWETNATRLHGLPPGPATLEEFRAASSTEALTQMTLDDLGPLLDEHPDVDVVTDVKGRSVEGLRRIAARFPGRLGRFVPQIYRPSEHDDVRALGFERIVLTLYAHPMTDEEVLEFCEAAAPYAVTMPVARANGSDLAARLREAGVFVYAHTVNTRPALSALRRRGVGGVYTDFLSPRLETRDAGGDGDGLPAWTATTAGSVALGRRVIPFVPPPHGAFDLRISLATTAEAARTVRLVGLDAGGEPRGVHETAVTSDGLALELREALPDPRVTWIAIEAPDDVTSVARWRYHGRADVPCAAVDAAVDRVTLTGPAEGLFGHVLVLVNPLDAPVEVEVARRVGDADPRRQRLTLAPSQQVVRVHPLGSAAPDAEVELTVEGGPFVWAHLRFDATLSFLR